MSSPSSVSWSSVPKKAELAIICSVRIADFFQQAALQAIMFYQLSSFAPEASESDISFQVGVLQGVFTAAQIFTSVIWGKIADHPSWGRKRVILSSLIGQGFSCLGVAFSKTFAAAVFWRFLGGAVNASVGGARTVLSEKTEKKYHSRTFLLLPFAWNIAQFTGPPISGLLSDPVKYHPNLFGNNSTFGGETGVAWLKKFPYAAPNLCCTMVLFADAFLVWVGLGETLQSRETKRDRGLEFNSYVRSILSGSCVYRSEYTRLHQDDEVQDSRSEDVELWPVPSSQTRLKQGLPGARASGEAHPSRSFPLLRALTSNVMLVLTTVAFVDFGMGAFTALWTMFLSSERYRPGSDPPANLPFQFTGGLGFPPSRIGMAMSMLGVVGIICQFALFPRVSERLGLIQSMQ